MVALKSLFGGLVVAGALAVGGLELPKIRNAVTSTFDRLIQNDEERLTQLEECMDGYGPRVPRTESAWPLVVVDYNNPKFKGLYHLRGELGLTTDDLAKIYYEKGRPIWNPEKIKERCASE